MKWVFSDGGRARAGYKGLAGDCAVRAIAIATSQDYQVVYDAINLVGKQERITKNRPSRSTARGGVYKDTMRKYMESIGWTWHATMHFGSGCKVHLRPEELPSGRLIVSLSKHFCAVIDGVVYDLYDPSRNGTRCVYGYYSED